MSSTNAPKRLSFCSPSLSCSSEIAPPPPKGIFFIMACMLPATIGIGVCNYVCQEVGTIKPQHALHRGPHAACRRVLR